MQETNSNFSSLLMITHVPKLTVLQYEEVPSYTFITFLSAIGGIMGVFMGFSLWSFYSMCIAPITKQIEKLICRKNKINPWNNPKTLCLHYFVVQTSQKIPTITKLVSRVGSKLEKTERQVLVFVLTGFFEVFLFWFSQLSSVNVKFDTSWEKENKKP